MTITIKNLFRLSFVFLLAGFMIACSKDDDKKVPTPGGSDKDALVTYPWRLIDVTDVNGNKIPENKLDVTTNFLFELNFAFAANNTVKAQDKTGQVQNGGTWYLKEDNKILDIDVSGFKGQFEIKALSNSKMSLQNDLKVGGVDQKGILVFAPVIR
jgi:hypothetical protein